MALPPVLTPEQRAESLAKAARVRKERSEALAAIRSGSVEFAAVLDDEDSPLQGARVRQVVLAVPGIGPATADKIFADLGINGKRRLSGLGSRQREGLAACLS